MEKAKLWEAATSPGCRSWGRALRTPLVCRTGGPPSPAFTQDSRWRTFSQDVRAQLHMQTSAPSPTSAQRIACQGLDLPTQPVLCHSEWAIKDGKHIADDGCADEWKHAVGFRDYQLEMQLVLACIKEFFFLKKSTGSRVQGKGDEGVQLRNVAKAPGKASQEEA